MVDPILPALPSGQRWFIKFYGGSVELNLQERHRRLGILPHWKTVARALIYTDYPSKQLPLQRAVTECLDGKDWREDIKPLVERERRRQKRLRAAWKTGPVDE